MTIHELLQAVLAEPGDAIHVQLLAEAMINITAKTRPARSHVTFATTNTSPGEVLNNDGPIGVILWVPRALWAKHAGKKP